MAKFLHGPVIILTQNPEPKTQNPMLKIRNLSAYYGSVRALSGVTMHIREGEIVTLIGANGAGKTTLLNAVCGLVRQQGEVSFAGRPLSGLAPEEIVGLGISQVPEGRQLFAPMTVAENLELGAYRRHRKESKAAINADQDRVVLAEGVAADRDYPAVARSVRDGFAVRSIDLPGELAVIGKYGPGRVTRARWARCRPSRS